MGRDRVVAVVAAIALHAGVIDLALSLRRVALPPIRLSDPGIPRIQFWRLPQAAAVPSARSERRGRGSAAHAPAPAAEVLLPEREIIDQGHGVTMTIEGGSSSDAGVSAEGDPAQRGPPLSGEQWLRLEVRVPSITTAPRPSDYCVPREPEMPEQAVERSITGRVEVSYEVDADGVVSSIALERDAPLLLSRSVKSWLQGCLFEPATQDGRRVPARVKQAFVFRIR